MESRWPKRHTWKSDRLFLMSASELCKKNRKGSKVRRAQWSRSQLVKNCSMTSLKRGKRSTRIWTECSLILETQRTISIQDLKISKNWNDWSCSQRPSSKSSKRVSSNCERCQKLAINGNVREIKQHHESRDDLKLEIHEWTRRTTLVTSYRKDPCSIDQL